MHKCTFARKLTELYISYKDTKLSNDRKTRVAIEEKMLKSVKDGEKASTVDLGDWIYVNFTGDNGSEIGMVQEMRKKNASGKNTFIKSVNIDQIDSTIEVRCFWLQRASWVKNVTKTLNVCGKNVTETVKHAYTCYDMAELKFWPLC
eukprot:Nk52_evm2s540 gene=Nk52_evmTU2s540